MNAGIPRVAQVIPTPDVFDINVVVVAPPDGPWLIESERIATVLEAVVPVDHPGAAHAKRVVMTKMGAVTGVRNAAIMVAIVAVAVIAIVATVVGNGASPLLASLLLLGRLLLLLILASLLLLPRLHLPLCLLFFLLLGVLRPLLLLLFLTLLLLMLLLPLFLGIGRYAHSY